MTATTGQSEAQLRCTPAVDTPLGFLSLLVPLQPCFRRLDRELWGAELGLKRKTSATSDDFRRWDLTARHFVGQTDCWSQKRRHGASDPTLGSDTDSAHVDESVSLVIAAPEDGGPSTSGPTTSNPTPIHDTDPVGYFIGETLSSGGLTSPEAVGIQEDDFMVSISSSSEEEVDDSGSCIGDVKNLCERIMLEASAGLPSHIARGTINGVSGTYGATQINGTASKTTQWRRRKESEATSARRDGKDAAFKQHGTKSMVTHFFRRQSGSTETENDVTHEAIESNNSDACDSERNSDSSDSGADEIVDRRIRGFQASIPARLYRAPTIDEASESTTALLQLIRTRRGTGVGWKYTNMDLFSLKRLQQMLRLFCLYTKDPDFMGKWTRASRSVAVSEGRRPHFARDLRR